MTTPDETWVKRLAELELKYQYIPNDVIYMFIRTELTKAVNKAREEARTECAKDLEKIVKNKFPFGDTSGGHKAHLMSMLINSMDLIKKWSTQEGT